VPEAADPLIEETFLARTRENSAPKTVASKYNSTADSVTQSEKSASSYE
jgi:hypothetical protein